ncbi:unnamed protein product [Heterotrigona itama]|uniref:Cytochrome P450 n=1 Tax=Heterotrigona itama TaxID=395501 RepID=A0A6V7HGD4_9HYME|nr:unnamed protein product [Heterotrigona itama]
MLAKKKKQYAKEQLRIKMCICIDICHYHLQQLSPLFKSSQHLIKRATMAYLEILCAVTALLLAFCYYSTSAFGFWKNRGIPGPKPVFFFGNSMDILFSRLSTAEYLHKVYQQFKNEPMFGVYMRRSAILVLKDPELIKDVMVRDFSNFSDRGLIVYERVRHVALPNRKLISSVSYFYPTVLVKKKTSLSLEISKLLQTNYRQSRYQHNSSIWIQKDGAR